ncbi:cell division protein ZipA [Caldichromatium japonicum]|uniref:Cell division protein ZipA n=1 Tax=Caldichromatium japonicum TaxID=2699430 RepID=A0A6G7VDN2_9GAMM|nr:cell division protein ZipA [Caldichromatium japonicum]QIK37995.1 cell division protein ZipA [Caldichromatium japonicum]
MDATTIRLILIAVGVILILALYLWERHRERQLGAFDDDDADDNVLFDGETFADHLSPPRREPRIGRAPETDETSQPAPAQPQPANRQRPGASPEVAPMETTASAARPKPSKLRREPRVTEPLLIQLSISARRYPFRGPEILDIAASCGLYPGEMDIFHCFDEFDDETRVYFSMANMVKPGTFPLDDMESFSTPGLVLFAQLEGDPEDLTIFEEMVATARKLAMTLNGDVLDENRKPLTVNKEEELRQAVLAHGERWLRVKPR